MLGHRPLEAAVPSEWGRYVSTQEVEYGESVSVWSLNHIPWVTIPVNTATALIRSA